MQERKYSLSKINSIIDQQGWVGTTCNDEPKVGDTTIKISFEEDGGYFGEFVGNAKKDEYMFKFYI